MKRKILGLLFAFCLIVPCGMLLSACGDATYSIVTEAQNATITLQTDEAKKDDTITFDVVVDKATEDCIYELEKVYYLVEGNEQENVLTSETGTYSFTMPEGNVVIYAEVNQIKVYNETITQLYSEISNSVTAMQQLADEISSTSAQAVASSVNTTRLSSVSSFISGV